MKFTQEGGELWGKPAEGETKLLKSAVRVARAFYAGRCMPVAVNQMNEFHAGLSEPDEDDRVKGPIESFVVMVEVLTISAPYMDMQEAQAVRALAADIGAAISESEPGATG